MPHISATSWRSMMWSDQEQSDQSLTKWYPTAWFTLWEKQGFYLDRVYLSCHLRWFMGSSSYPDWGTVRKRRVPDRRDRQYNLLWKDTLSLVDVTVHTVWSTSVNVQSTIKRACGSCGARISVDQICTASFGSELILEPDSWSWSTSVDTLFRKGRLTLTSAFIWQSDSGVDR